MFKAIADEVRPVNPAVQIQPLHGLRRKPRLRGLEQITIEDRHVVARMNLTSVFGFPAGAGTWGRIGSQRPTAWLRMQSEAKRSRGRISLQFAICREILRNCRESRSYCCQVS
jgi:hypothetical protein